MSILKSIMSLGFGYLASQHRYGESRFHEGPIEFVSTQLKWEILKGSLPLLGTLVSAVVMAFAIIKMLTGIRAGLEGVASSAVLDIVYYTLVTVASLGSILWIRESARKQATETEMKKEIAKTVSGLESESVALIFARSFVQSYMANRLIPPTSNFQLTK